MADPTLRILIATYPTPTGADDGLKALQNGSVRLGNAAVIRHEHDGEVSFRETQDWGVGKSALIGGVAGLLLPGLGTIVGAAGGAIAAYFLDLGFPDEQLKQFGNGLDRGTSALIVLVDGTNTRDAEAAVQSSGGTVLGSGLEADLARAMQATGRG